MTMTICPDPFVVIEFHDRDQRAQQYVGTLLPYPPDDPDDGMTTEGDVLQRVIPDAFETSTINTSEYLGPSSNTAAN
jgi:hypothetical protein